MDATAIVLAAGAGRRVGGPEPKAFLKIGGHAILEVAVAAAAASPSVGSVVVAVPEGFERRARGLLGGLDEPVTVVTGGPSRQASVRAALKEVPEGVELIAVHDAARPFAPPDLFTRVLDAVSDGADGAVPVLPMTDTVKRVHDGWVLGTEPREDLGLAQTPQAFVARALRDAHAQGLAQGLEATDDAAVMEAAGYRLRAIPGDPQNVKITTVLDLAAARERMGEGA